MQTMYYTTNHFVRHTGNVVDLSEYRRKLALVQEACCSGPEHEEASAPAQELCPRPRRSAARRQARRAMMLDVWASVGVLVMTLTFTLHVLCL